MHTVSTVAPWVAGVAGYLLHYATVKRQLAKHARLIRMVVNAAKIAVPVVNDIATLGPEAERETDTGV